MQLANISVDSKNQELKTPASYYADLQNYLTKSLEFRPRLKKDSLVQLIQMFSSTKHVIQFSKILVLTTALDKNRTVAFQFKIQDFFCNDSQLKRQNRRKHQSKNGILLNAIQANLFIQVFSIQSNDCTSLTILKSTVLKN